jgi:APA family basic amino acid/polyamine antiporter
MSSNKTLVKGLGQLEATTLVVGGIIGTTIFLITSNIAELVGSPMLVFITWIVAGLLAGAAALCFAELSAAMPETGGTYVFLRRAYNSELISFAFAWMICFAYGTGAIAVVAIMAATFLVPVLAAFEFDIAEYVNEIAVVLIVVLTLLNSSGVRRGGLTQNVLTALKVSLLLLVILIPLVLVDMQLARLVQGGFGNDGLGTTLQNVSDAMILCLFSYSGAYFVTHVAEEVREPHKNIPRAIIVGFLIVFGLYLLANVTYMSTMSFVDVKSSEHIASDVMARALGPKGAVVTAFVIFCSAVGVLNAQLLNYPRIVFALARDGYFFRRIAKINERSRAPSNAIVLVGIIASIFALSGSYVEILGYIAFVIHFFVCLAVLAVIILRIREPELPRPYKVWGYPFTPVAFLLISIVYLYNLIVTKPIAVMIGVGIVLVGVPFYFYWSRKNAASAAIL